MNGENYLFTWDDVPGRDNGQLISHLEKCVGALWARNAEIKKDSVNRTITVTDGKNTFTLRLENTAVLDVGNGQTYEYEVKRERGKITVYNKETCFILCELDSQDDDELRNLANSVKEKCLKDPKALVNVLHSNDEENFLKAAAVLLEIGDIALGPLLDALDPSVPERWVWDMQAVVELQVNNRMRVAKALENMLEDKRAVPLPEPPPNVEEEPVPRRVCDEAYLMLRKLLAFEESEEERYFNANTFLNMTDDERDVEIKRAKTSKRWASLTG